MSLKRSKSTSEKNKNKNNKEKSSKLIIILEGNSAWEEHLYQEILAQSHVQKGQKQNKSGKHTGFMLDCFPQIWI